MRYAGNDGKSRRNWLQSAQNRHVLDHCYFERSDANQIKLRARSGTGKLENELVHASDLACELLDSFGVPVHIGANREPVSIRILG